MSELYCVEVSGAPVREQRFATFFGNEYSGFQCVQFVPLSKVIYKDQSTGQMTSHKGLSWCQRITDDLQQAVKDGWNQTWIATARVVKYIPATHSFQVIYVGKTDTTAAAEPVVPAAMLASDGTWRKTPTVGFSKGAREWALAIAFVDHTNRERADRFNAKNKLDTITQLFESPILWHQEYVRSLPLADPKDIPAPSAPKVEYVPTQAELDAVAPLNSREWNLMPKDEFKRRYAFDPLFRESYRKMIAVEERQKKQDEQRRARLTEEEELKKVREEFNKHDENEKLKGGVGTIL